MGMYEIPRDTKGEGKILLVFSTKALIYTAVGLLAGLLIYAFFKSIALNIVGLVILVLFGFIGFAVGTFKVPDNNSFYITQKCGGSTIDDVLKRAIKFLLKKKKIYVYTKEVHENDVK